MRTHRTALDKGRLLGQKPPLEPKEIWSLRIRVQLADEARDLALFNLAIDSKLRGCDLVSLRVRDVYQGSWLPAERLSCSARRNDQCNSRSRRRREAVAAWVSRRDLRSTSYLFPGRSRDRHLSLRQYSRIVEGWAGCIGLDQSRYGTHTLRRSKPTLLYKRTKNIRAIQFLLGHTKLESTVR
jgi:integrase